MSARLFIDVLHAWLPNRSPAALGTVPVDAIRVRRFDRATLETLDPAAQHVIRSRP